MVNRWVEHVKSVAKKQNIPYSQALSVASSSYNGRQAEQERQSARHQRAQMMRAEMESNSAYERTKQAYLVEPPQRMKGKVFEDVKNSPTFQHFVRRSNDLQGLVQAYNSLSPEVRAQYNIPRTPFEYFAILKNQRRGMVKRQPRK